MNNQEAIDIIKNNWPDERYTILKDALTLALIALSDSPEWRVPDETTPDAAAVWRRLVGLETIGLWDLKRWGTVKEFITVGETVLVKENQGPPPDDYRPKETQE